MFICTVSCVLYVFYSFKNVNFNSFLSKEQGNMLQYVITSLTGAMVPQCFFSLKARMTVSCVRCTMLEKRFEGYTLQLNRCEHHSDSWASVALRVEWSSSDQWFSPKVLLSIH